MHPKEIVAQFLKVESTEIHATTLINRQALKSSIFVHRMYGKLADAGYPIDDYSNISSFGELENLINKSSTIEDLNKSLTEINAVRPSELSIQDGFGKREFSNGIGIDIEMIASLPMTHDFREEGFYKENFNEKEIAYCILQPDPYVSFLGLFAIKEAIIKADNTFRAVKFNQINITYDAGGKPQFSGMSISISHTDNTAVAVAIKNNNANPTNPVIEKQSNSKMVLLIAILALIVSLLALIKGFNY